MKRIFEWLYFIFVSIPVAIIVHLIASIALMLKIKFK
jgi:hypothetical protein